jgi:hypothetical protein
MKILAGWWTCWAVCVAYALVPGSARSPFSGIPLSSKAILLVALLLILGVATAMFRPSRRVHPAICLALFAAVAAKIFLATLLIPAGWRGEYSYATRTLEETHNPWQRAWFQDGTTARPFRVDRAIDFEGINFGLSFINEIPPQNTRWKAFDRATGQPLIVRWTGHVDAPKALPLRSVVTAHGSVVIRIDGQEVLRARNPRQLPFAKDTLPAGSHTVEIEYTKPPDVKPAIHVASFESFPVTAMPATANAVRRSTLASRGIDAIGLLSLLLLVAAFAQAYGRFSRFFLEEIWLRPDRVAAIALFALFVMAGVRRAIPESHATTQLGIGDDPLAYEGSARLILRNGMTMLGDDGTGNAYYFYPLYPYALALSHTVMGDDYSAILILNYLCAASLILLMWALLRQRLSRGSTVVVLVLFTFFVKHHVLRWAGQPYTDNLFAPLTLATILTTAIAIEKRSARWMFFTGILTALGAATRPSMLLHLPVMALAVLFFRDLGSIRRRLGSSIAFVTGFFAGVSPFTIRNWIVSHRFVLLVASFIMIPYFMFAPEDKRPSFLIDGEIPNAVQSIVQGFHIFTSDPLHVTWTELRKVLFTFGLTQFGIEGVPVPYHFLIFPLLFGVALWTRRVDRPVAAAVLTFGASHLAAMIVGAPWTYGYKTILPFHIAAIAGAAFLLPRRNEAYSVGTPLEHRPAGPQQKRSVSVVLPTYNEKDSIRACILDFMATGVVDEVLVINNNAAAGTSEEVAGTGAVEIMERRQGYGAAVQRGLAEAKGDWIVVCEPDGTFLPGDIHKLIAYAGDFDVVYGTRTAQQMVWRGANMGTFLRWGNWVVAKYLEFLYNATSLTDVGCTMRLIRREAAQALRPQFRIQGSQFGPEMMLLSLRAGFRVIQIPVNYLPRVGESSVTGDPEKAFRLGLEMLWLITSRRFEHLFAGNASTDPAEERRANE